jgi:flagellar FliL protein
MAKTPVRAETAETDAAEGEGAAAPAPKKGLAGRLLGPVLAIPRLLNPLRILKLPPKLRLVAAAGLLVVLGGAGAGAYLFLTAAPATAEAGDEAVAQAAPNPAEARLPTANTSFLNLPDIIVNLQTPDGSQAYLKLTAALEIEQPDAAAAVEPVMPRVIDQFQTYLRELRVEDVRGSAGVMRLKEELLRRVNLALAPMPVRDVLLKELIVQ